MGPKWKKNPKLAPAELNNQALQVGICNAVCPDCPLKRLGLEAFQAAREDVWAPAMTTTTRRLLGEVAASTKKSSETSYAEPLFLVWRTIVVLRGLRSQAHLITLPDEADIAEFAPSSGGCTLSVRYNDAYDVDRSGIMREKIIPQEELPALPIGVLHCVQRIMEERCPAYPLTERSLE